MMNIPLFIILLLVLQLVCFYVAKKVSRKLDTQEDYFLAGKSVRFFPLLMTLIATQIGGGLILGSAEEAYRYGWYVLLYPLGIILGFLLLAIGIGKKLAQFNVPTVAQLFEVVYHSPRLKQVASLLSIISLFMILVGQVIASKKFMASVGVDQNVLFIAFWGLVILYTVLGGLKAVVATDIIQAAFFVLVFIACMAYSLLSTSTANIDVFSISNSTAFAYDPEKLSGWLLMPLLFMVIEQDMAQRCFAAKSGKAVTLATACAALCILAVCAIPIYYGILAKVTGIAVPQGSSVLMAVVGPYTTPTLAAFMGCAILAAILSTADSLINAISSNIAQDFNFNRTQLSKQKVKFAQIITAAIGFAALIFSAYFDSVVGILIQSYELSVSCLFVPIFAALFIRKGNASSAVCAIACGAVGFILFRFVALGPIPREVSSLALSSLGYFGSELLLRLTHRSPVTAEKA